MSSISDINTIVERLISENKFRSKKAISKYLDYNYTYFIQMLNGDKPLSYDFENLFFEKFPKNTFNNSAVSEPKEIYKPEIKQTEIDGYLKVPLVPVYAYAGFLNGYGDTAYWDGLPTEIWEVDKEYKGNYVVFEVKGDSMDDNSVNAILEGDKLLCREINRVYWKDKLHINKWYFVIVHKEDGIIVKQIAKHDPETGDVVCKSLNEMYEDRYLNLKDVVALYNVVDLKRKPRI